MILDRDPPALERWIEDAAHDRVPVPPGDYSPWEAFYAEYREASPAVRARVDAAFENLVPSPDVEVRGAVATHWLAADPKVSLGVLSRILKDHPALYADQRTVGSSFTLRAWVLSGVASQSSGSGGRDLILAAVQDAGPLHGAVGTYFGGLGIDATEALFRARPDAGVAAAIKDSGYEPHRGHDTWTAALARSANSPAPLRAALLEGGAEHRARFGGP